MPMKPMGLWHFGDIPFAGLSGNWSFGATVAQRLETLRIFDLTCVQQRLALVQRVCVGATDEV